MQSVVCSSASIDFIYKNGYYGQLSIHKGKERILKLCVKACVRLVVHLPL
jgi:hypothetical protein